MNPTPIKAAKAYVGKLNSGNQTSITPTSGEYHMAGGDKKMAMMFKRHGQDALYRHIMAASFDPVYGREFSLAQPEEVKPARAIPLAEFGRKNERSERRHEPKQVYQPDHSLEEPQKPDEFAPAEKKTEPYAIYSSKYGGDKYKSRNYKAIERGKNSAYKIVSMVKALEKRGKEYFLKKYDAFRERLSEVGAKISYPTQGAKAYNFRKGPASSVARALCAIATQTYNLPVEMGQEEEKSENNQSQNYPVLVGSNPYNIRDSYEIPQQREPDLEAELATQRPINQGGLEKLTDDELERAA